MIALGIGVEGWSINRCIEEVLSLSRPAFTPRRGHNIWGIAQMIRVHNGGIYSTQRLEKALQEIFSSDPLFGGRRLVETLCKVALTATSAAGLQPTVLSNYNRTIDHEEKSILISLYYQTFTAKILIRELYLSAARKTGARSENLGSVRIYFTPSCESLAKSTTTVLGPLQRHRLTTNHFPTSLPNRPTSTVAYGTLTQ